MRHANAARRVRIRRVAEGTRPTICVGGPVRHNARQHTEGVMATVTIPKSTNTPLDELCINTMRFLAVDAVQKAKSGHLGMPMGSAAMAYTLWDRFLKFNPRDPAWPDRDRF